VDDLALAERLAIKNGIVQRAEAIPDGNEILNQTSEAKLARAIDIGDDDEDAAVAAGQPEGAGGAKGGGKDDPRQSRGKAAGG
jgi:hypothetical protein